MYNELVHGFLESIYQNAFIVELVNSDIAAESEKRIVKYYSEKPVGVFEADLIVEGEDNH